MWSKDTRRKVKWIILGTMAVIAAISLSHKQETLIQGLRTEPKIMGAIIPHHLTAKDLIEDLGDRLKENETKRVIIIGPNHDDVGKDRIITNNKIWGEKLEKLGLGKWDEVTMKKEHSFTAPVGILKEIMPKAEYVGIAISSRARREDLDKLAKLLASELMDNTVLVASVDFSHSLTYPEASLRDETSKRVVERQNLEALEKLNSQYVDSPKTLITLIKTMKKMKAELEWIGHSNSAIILDDYANPNTTSYFEAIYLDTE